LAEIRERYPNIKVVILSVSTDPDVIQAVLKRGAAAYIVKSVNPADFPAALRQAAEGTVFTTIGLPEDGTAAAAKQVGLTERELVILNARARTLQQRDRQGALGGGADGEVPPDEHLSQGRRGQSHRSGAEGLRARSDREPALRQGLSPCLRNAEPSRRASRAREASASGQCRPGLGPVADERDRTRHSNRLR